MSLRDEKIKSLLGTNLDDLSEEELNRKTIEIVKNFEEYLTNNHEIDKPVFVCGLARSGTTPITQMLYFTDEFSSLEYRDLPFIEIPLVWNLFNKFIYGKNKEIERFHKDGLIITQNSPDAFLEIIFKNNNTCYTKLTKI